MNNEKLDISVNICTLNEEANIEFTLANVIKNNPREIIVIDGDSDDQTEEKVKQFDCVKFVNVGRKGLAFQRQYGVENSTSKYLAIIDADDILEEDCLGKLICDLEEHQYKAIQAQVQSFEPTTFWERGMDKNVGYITPGETNMVGRPALYLRESLESVGFDPFFTFGNEDTDLSIRFEQLEYKQGVGTGISRRKHSDNFKECWSKWKGYGIGDARIITKYPEKRKNMLFHIAVRYPFILPFRLKGLEKLRYWPFFFLCGLRRSISCFKEYKVLKKKGMR